MFMFLVFLFFLERSAAFAVVADILTFLLMIKIHSCMYLVNLHGQSFFKEIVCVNSKKKIK